MLWASTCCLACTRSSSSSYSGSSPRVRGTAGFIQANQIRHRFIPARAGNGPTRPLSDLEPPVHPRACGERSCQPFAASAPVGSSPRVRGTACPPSPLGVPRSVHPRACGERRYQPENFTRLIGSSPRVRGTGRARAVGVLLGRFIPARAGNGCRASLQGRVSPVHPRACGER